jgi:UPF0755 protein
MPTMDRGRGAGGRARTGRSRRQVYVVRRALAAVAIFAVAVVLWFLWSLFQPFAGAGHGTIAVTIPANSSTSEVGSILAHDGVIHSSFFFRLRVKLDGVSSRIRSGYYTLALDMSYGAALHALTTQSGIPPTVDVTIIPGRSRRQVQAALEASAIKGNYVRATIRSKLLDPADYGAPPGTPTLEGFLWPDTYNLRRPAKIADLVADQLRAFKLQFARVDLAYARSKNLTAYDVLKIASLIAEESLTPADGPKVASVIYNRLRDGIDLGLDSTVSYATGNYGTLTDRDLASSSPWNTTNHPGLPPTPIDSPGLTDIDYAAHPAHTNYLYFINRVCGAGALRFTANYDRFLSWSRAWNAAVARAHGSIDHAEFCKSGKP